MNNDINSFTYSAYTSLVSDLLLDRDLHTFTSLKEGKVDNALLLRHDVDFSTGKALELAQIEADNGWRSSYFFLIATEQYNPFDCISRNDIRQIIDLGHEIGLHYDVVALAERNSTLDDALAREVDILSDLSGQKIDVIAMHNPSIYGEDPFRSSDIYINAYDERFTKSMSYFTDSCGAWRDASYAVLQNRRLTGGLQLGTHPMHWGYKPSTRTGRLAAVSAERQARMAEFESRTREIWSGHSGVQEHDLRLHSRSLDRN